jgi:hypothetical protein
MNKLCCKLYKDRTTIEAVLEEIDLPPIQKQHIQSRYITILENMKKRVHKYSIVFHIGHFIITVGSLFVPALLSIQNSNVSFSVNGYSIPVYIITFIVSLLVTIFNGILTLFKLVQPCKQYAGSDVKVMLVGKVKLVKPVHPVNALAPIEVTASGIVKVIKPAHPENAPSPITVTLSGIVTLFNLVQPFKIYELIVLK